MSNKNDGFSDTSLTGLFFTFKGRLNRKRYFMRLLLLGIIEWLLFRLVDGFGLDPTSLVIMIPCWLASFSLISRRAHDTGHSAALFLVLWIIPIINVLAGLYLLFREGNTGANEYGPDPLQPSL